MILRGSMKDARERCAPASFGSLMCVCLLLFFWYTRAYMMFGALYVAFRFLLIE